MLWGVLLQERPMHFPKQMAWEKNIMRKYLMKHLKTSYKKLKLGHKQVFHTVNDPKQ